MRAIWTGALGFGLVNIPVKIYSATQDSSLDLDMLDKKDYAHIKFLRVNEHTHKEVSWENIVKGYDYNGKMVVLEDKDFKRANAVKSELIEIDEFVKEAEINSMLYEVPYYIVPDKTGAKAYALLKEALQKTEMSGLCTFILRNREHLGLIKPEGNLLILNKIRFQEEIRDTEELDIPQTEVKANELKMAVTLINQLSGKFDIKKYKDNYAASLMKVIKAKAKGQKFEEPKLRISHSAKKDLMDQLQESLQAHKTKKAS